MLGPSGAGKSTLLRCLAGLTPLDAGRIQVDGVTLDAPAEHDCFVAPEHRPIGLVFQDHLLFPHLDARDNVAFGLRAAGLHRRAARVQATEWLTRVGMADHADRRPAQLSGGQAQRVALARALAPTPRLLLLDEPLAALDVGTRGEVRRELRRHLDSFDGMRVLVTHDPVDAYALAHHVVVVEDGARRPDGQLARRGGPTPIALRRRPGRRQPARRHRRRGGDHPRLGRPPGGGGIEQRPRAGGDRPPLGRVVSPTTRWQPPQRVAGDRDGPRSSAPTGCGCNSPDPSRWSPRSPPARSGPSPSRRATTSGPR